MPLKVLADESLDFRIVTALMTNGFETTSVLKEYPGISDREVMRLARENKAILITEDSDFGEWIFAHKEKNVSVIFLRYKPHQIENISSSLISLLNKYGAALYGKFVVLGGNKVRIRDIF